MIGTLTRRNDPRRCPPMIADSVHPLLSRQC
jgi:hypothetical protein